MNRLINNLFDTPTTAPGGVQRRWIPAIDLVETESDFVLRADLPGVAEDELSVELEHNMLTVSGERKSEHEERKSGYHRVERSSGSFSRRLKIPVGVDPESVTATFERGVLEVKVPKPERPQARRIAVTVGGGAAEPQAGQEREHSEPIA